MTDQEWIEPHDKIGTFGGVYCLGRKLGSGSFGHVYIVVNSETGQEYAAKVERSSTKNQMIPYEAKLLRRLQGAAGFPALHYCNVEGEYNVMVMDLLGPSLKDLFYMCNQKFSVKTALLLADQMLFRIQYLHSKGFLHRDIKPENFLVDWGRRASTVYLIDFGLAKRYRSAKTQQHIPYAENKSLTGTARYASVNAHTGIEQSRRDDCMAIGYVLIYFLQGQLPWQQLQADTKEEKYRKIMEAKKAMTPEELCTGQPEVFAAYMKYCQGLQFEERPDYTYLRHMCKEAFVCEGFTNDGVFDWMHAADNEKERNSARSSRSHQTLGENKTLGSADKNALRGKASSRAPSEVGATVSLQHRMMSMFSQSTRPGSPDARKAASASSLSLGNETGRNSEAARGDRRRRSGGSTQSPRRSESSMTTKGGGGKIGFLASLFRCGTKQ